MKVYKNDKNDICMVVTGMNHDACRDAIIIAEKKAKLKNSLYNDCDFVGEFDKCISNEFFDGILKSKGRAMVWLGYGFVVLPKPLCLMLDECYVKRI